MTNETDGEATVSTNEVLAQFRTNMTRPTGVRWEIDADDVEALADILDEQYRALSAVHRDLMLDGSADAERIDRERRHARALRESLLTLQGELNARAARW